MLKNKSSFNRKALLQVAIPSYIAPCFFSGLSGFFLDKPDLIKASYSTIALPSLFATLICFGLLWQFQKRQYFLLNRYKMALVLGVLMLHLAILCVYIFRLQHEVWNIVPSTLIGSVIVALTKPLK